MNEDTQDVSDMPVHLVVIPFPSEFHAKFALEDITKEFAYRGCVVKSTIGGYSGMKGKKED